MNKMKLFKQTPFIKLFIVTSIIIALICGVYFVISTNQGNTSEPTNGLLISDFTTPTPYTLPIRVYDQPSYIAKILEQIFDNKNNLPNPSEIMKNTQKRSSNEYLDLHVQNGNLPIYSQWWQQESKQVYEYVRNRVDTTINEKVIVILVSPQTGNCAPRGTTFLEKQPIILIFANQDTNKDQILATLAHELGHVFIHKRYENLSDTALVEGMATWASGDYWKAWKGMDINTSVRSYIADNSYLPLFQNYDLKKAFNDTTGCITYRDILLTEFASFIDYLIKSYGLEKLSALFNVQQPELLNKKQIVYPPEYKAVYGYELNQLEQEWLRALLNNK